MTKEILDKAAKWTGSEYDDETRRQVQDLIDNDPKELEDAFYKDLEFGTGGLRGVMGPGTNRMNKYTVAIATQGLANYINKEIPGTKCVAIAHDSRNNSHLFARKAAEVMAANGIKVYLFPELRPTPQLSFAIRFFKCVSGIVITASHNPKEYNGYKVYWSDGAQIVAPHDKGIIEEVRKITSPEQVVSGAPENLIEIIGREFDEKYRDVLLAEMCNPEVVKRQKDMKIVYTPLHGTGITQVPATLEQMGFEAVHIVEEQATPDGNFPTVESPNPEEKAALELALELGRKVDAEIILGTDPDCDRVGIAVKDLDGSYILLNGNETCTLLTHYLLEQHTKNGTLPANGYVCRTIVTTELIDKMAADYNVGCYVTLTGFKHIATVIRELEGKEKFIGGGEESYGYMIGDKVRDKDAAVTAAMLCEIAAWAVDKGSSLYRELIEIYKKYDYYKESLVSLVRKGKSGAAEIEAIMKGYRQNPPAELAGSEVLKICDYQENCVLDVRSKTTETTGQPRSNVMQFYLADGSKITVRPSGTEPKIKYYFSVHTPLEGVEEFAGARANLEKRLEALSDEFVQP